MAATETVIKSMGRTGQISAEQIAEMAGSLSAAEGKSLFGDSDIQAGQNMLLTFANINEVLPEATQAMVDMTQFMGGDMVGASTMLGKALDNPTQGLSALSRVGVSFTEQQKEQIKTMQEAGNMAGAQGIILEALKSQFGGQAEAAARADQGWAQWRDRMGEVAEGVGTKLLPALGLIPAALNSPEVMGAIEGFASGLGTVLGGVITWITTTGVPLFITAVSSIATAINDWIIVPAQNVATAFSTWSTFGTEWGIVAALQEIGAAFPAIQPLTDWLQTVAPPLVQGIREGFGLARDSFITFRDALAGEWNADPEKIHPLHLAIGEFGLQIRNEVLPALGGLYTSLLTEAPVAWATFKTSIQQDVIPILQFMVRELNKQSNEDLPKAGYSWEQFGSRLEQVINDAMWVAQGWGEDLRNIIKNTVTDAFWMVGQWGDALIRWGTVISGKIDEAVGWFQGLPDRITGAIPAASTILHQIGVNIVQGLIDGLTSMIPSMTGVLDTITSLIPKHKGPPEEDARLLFENGRLIIQGLIDGFGDMKPELVKELSSITDLIGRVFNVISSGVGALSDLAGYKPGLLRDTVVLFANDLMGTVSTIEAVVLNFSRDGIKAAAEWAESAGRVVSIIGSGVDALTNLKDYTVGLTRDTVLQFAHDVYGVVTTLQIVVRDFDQDAIAAAAKWSESAGKIVGIIGSAVSGLTALIDIKAVPAAAFDMLAQGIRLAVEKMTDIARQFDVDGTAAAAVFAEATGKILGPIGIAVDAFTKLRDYKGVLPWMFDMLGADIRLAVTKMIDLAQNANKEGVAAAAAFSEAVTNIFGGLKAAVDTLAAIREYKGIPPEAIQAFSNDFIGVVSHMSILITNGTIALTQAETWKTQMEAFRDAINVGVEAIKSIASIPAMPAVPGTASPAQPDYTGSRNPFFSIPGRATGGPVAAGMPYLVGERGRELFVPRQSGTVVPNNKLGDTYQYTIMVDARGSSDPAAVEEAGYRGAQRAIRELNRSGNVLTELRSGGRF